MRTTLCRAVAGVSLLAGSLSAGYVAVAAEAGGAGAAAGARITPALATVEPAAVAPRGARALGPIQASATITGEVVLRPRNEASLTSFIAAVTDKASPAFGHYLRPGTFASRFGPSERTIAAVRTALQHEGLAVTGVSSDGLLVHFRAAAATVERAFHTGIERYRLSNGTGGSAATSALRLPPTIARDVTAVVGIDHLVQPQPVALLRASNARSAGAIQPATSTAFSHPKGSPTACSAAKSAAARWGGLTDDSIANSYGAFGLYGGGDVGSGQHIALYELEPFSRSDIKTFDTCYFGATKATDMLKRLKVVKVDGGQPSGPGSGEAMLDVEDLSALAPGASIDVYEAPSYGTNGIDYDPVDNYAAIVNADRDQVVSTSWGLCEQAIQAGQPGLQQAENLLFQQAAAQGQSIFSAAGDNGSDDCNTSETSTPISGQNPLSVDDPGSQPYVVGVGGTTISDATEPPTERVWNDGANGGGGGGGISHSWTMPAWQRAATVPGIALPGSADYKAAASVEKSFGYPTDFCQSTVVGATSSTPCRLVPDVSAQADWLTGAITVYMAAGGGWGTIGGTSSATPIWAALTALTNASSTCTSQAATKHGVGFVSPLLYDVASSPAEYKASFNDVTVGGNDVYGLADGVVYHATPGYDLASGLGSPRLTGPGGTAGLAYYLCKAATSTSRPVVSSVSPSSGSTAGGEVVTITGSGYERGGKPAVSSIEVGAAQLSSADFTVDSATSISATLPPAVDTRAADSPVPQDGAGSADVVVTLTGDTSSAPSPSARFQYVDMHGSNAVPSVTGLVPVGGSETAPSAVTIFGAGFTGATGVTFGAVPATSFHVKSSSEITAVPPAYSSSTKCAPLPTTGVYKGENATNDVCQVQVLVTNASGSNKVGLILPPAEGVVTVDNLGALVPPAGCSCETQPAPTEYDYLPSPHIDAVSTSRGPTELASEQGGTVVTIVGSGLAPMTLDWANIGPAGKLSSVDTNYVYATGTALQLVAPAESITTDRSSFPLSVQTLGGLSPTSSVAYAGVPRITSVVNTHDGRTWDGIGGAPDTGGTPLDIRGKGLSAQLLAPIQFSDAEGGYSSGTQYQFTALDDDAVTTQTVQQDPGLVDVTVCTVSGCNVGRPSSRLYLYDLGAPKVTSMQPTSGPAAGGTKLSLRGQNLGCVFGVWFGSVKARSAVNPPSLVDCGDSSLIRAVSPRGTAGTSVVVRVMTAESYFTRSGKAPSPRSFTYSKT